MVRVTYGHRYASERRPMPWNRRILVASGVAVTSLVLGVAAAIAGTYAGPKTWLAGWEQTGSYDSPSYRWDYNEMGPKADDPCYLICTSRVAFVNSGGSWSYSHTDAGSWTWTEIPPSNDGYQKTPLCKNNSSNVYDAQCDVDNFYYP